jgi:MFS family permease
MAEAGQERASMRTVVAASSAGTAFEWYDFFIFGSLTQVISKTFFAGLTDTAGYIAALALFGVGFAFRPLGALVFGKIGDQAGRKGAFLATVLLMGGATFAIAFLPTYQQAGIISPILLILMRCVQGFALGGEYGGAAIYVAEHSSPGKRGWSTSWVQSSASFGLFAALLVILATRATGGRPPGQPPSTPGAGVSRSPFRSACWRSRSGCAEAQRKPAFARHEGRGRGLQGALCRGLRPVEEPEAGAAGLLR